MLKLGELVFAIGLTLMGAAFPALAQQTQQQMPMMGHGMITGGQGMMNPGMMNPGMMNPGMMNPGMMNSGMTARRA